MPLYNIKKIISKKPKLGNLLFYISPYLPLPLFLLIHITLSCNKKCKWCYQRSNQFFSENCSNMPVEEFQKILISMRSKFWLKPHIHLYGGEPLCHPEFPLFLECCQKYGYKPTLTTNADYLGKYTKTIIDSSLSQLNISVNHLLDANGIFNSDLISEINFFTKTNDRKKIINLNYALDFDNFNYLDDIVLYLHRNYKKGNFTYFVIQHLMSNNISGIDKNNFKPEILIEKLARLKEMKLNFGLIFLPNIKLPDIEKYYFSDYSFENKCYVPWAGLSIYPNLKVAGGAAVLSCNEIFGDLNKETIDKIWHGYNLSNFRASITQNGLPKLCNRCCHKIYY